MPPPALDTSLSPIFSLLRPLNLVFSVAPSRRPATSAHGLKVEPVARGVSAQGISLVTKSGPLYSARIAPVFVSTEAMAGWYQSGSWPLPEFLAMRSAMLAAAVAAASCRRLSIVVMILRPPPSIWAASKPAVSSSSLTLFTR